jgi:hypothetical protein
MTIIVCV